MDAADLAFAGIARQAELIRAGEISSRELTETYLERIGRLDPRLNAFRVVLADHALTAADQADARRRAGEQRPLLGVPVAIKDDVDVAGEVTAHGSNAYGPPPAADAEVVRHLRAAGAVVIGKTNVPELEIMPFTESPTWGVTRNPWDVNRTPGGSSGGSGAAVAAGLVGAALGSDGAGSIRIPAACCGIFGLKPQHGRVSSAPQVDPWHGLSVWGPLTRRVADAALFLDTVKSGGPSFAEAAMRRPATLRVAQSLAVPLGSLGRPDAEQQGAVQTAAALLRELGHEVIERDPDYGLTVPRSMARYLRGIHDAAYAMPHPQRLSRRTLGYARLGALASPAVMDRVHALVPADRERLNHVFDSADVLLTPVLTSRAVPVGKWEGRSAPWTFNGTAMFAPYCVAWNHTGQPAAAVPVGFADDGFPLSVQLVARPQEEATLLSLAAQIEQARPWTERRPPVS